jgi:glycerol kinase
LAGLQVGVWPDLAALQKLTQTSRRFDPQMDGDTRKRQRELWHRAVQTAIAFYRDIPG